MLIKNYVVLSGRFYHIGEWIAQKVASKVEKKIIFCLTTGMRQKNPLIHLIIKRLIFLQKHATFLAISSPTLVAIQAPKSWKAA